MSDHDAAWFEGALNAMTELVLIKGDGSRLLWANTAFRDLYGMTNDQLRDLIDAAHSDPDHTLQYVRDDHHVFSTGQPLEVTEPVDDANGVTEYYETVKTAVRDPKGQVVRTVGVSRKVKTDSERAAVAARQAETKSALEILRAFVRGIPLAVAMLDRRQGFVAQSAEWEALFERTPARDDTYSSVCGGMVSLDGVLDAVVQTERPASLVDVSLKKRGRQSRSLDVDVHPWRLASGAVGGTIVTLHDVTELRQVNNELSQFTYRVSHDFVAPLKTIKGLIYTSGLLVKAGRHEQIAPIHERMEAAVDSLINLVSDVMSLARADALESLLERVSLAEVIAAVLETHQDEIALPDVTVTVDLAVTTIASQRIRLVQIMENLVSNALKFRHAETPHTVSVRSESRDDHVVITVRDSGVGFDETQRDRIFDFFTRGSSAHPGHGLGLYIVAKHIEALGARIEVPSTRDDTVFEVWLPNRHAAPGPTPRPAPNA